MWKKVNNILAGIPMTIISGIFLILSFVCSHRNISLPFDFGWVTVIISGIPLLYLAIWRIIHNPGISKISSALLIVIAMSAAVAIGDLFAAGEVAFIMAIGAILEDMTTDRAKKGLKNLISLAPTQGRRLVNGREEMIPADTICQNDVLKVLPGETIPVDGMIIDGETSIDQSIMTGESLPVDKETGDEVYCGTLNRFGQINIKATKVGENSSLQKLIKMVEDAEKKQAPMQRTADRCASLLVPAALLIAVIAGIITHDIVRAVTVLVVFCPCALVLATPTAIMAAIGQAAKHGVIIKSGEALETMGKVDTIAFDKTGTLTYGKLEVNDLIVFDSGLSELELLTYAASGESKSEHPLGKAIAACAASRNIKVPDADDFKMSAGKGITAKVDGRTFFMGNEKYLNEQDIRLNETMREALSKCQTEGKAVVLVAAEKDCIGMVTLSDVLKSETKDMILALSSMNTKTVLLTGDNQKTADYFAAMAGISEIHAELLPEEKVSHISALMEKGKRVCMIGDGINDAPALKTAHVGVAMGSMGSDIAVEAADIALMSDDVSKIPYLKRLSVAAVKTIKTSIALSMTINFIAVTCSVLGLLTPTTGALVHNAGSCFVVLFAALLYDRKF